MDQTIPICLNLVASFIGAFGQYFYKLGGQKLKTAPLLQNWEIFLGMILFIGVMFLFIISFKLGGRLSVTYPVYASTFIMGSAIGIFIDKEPWNFSQLIGTGLVVVGITVIALSANKQVM